MEYMFPSPQDVNALMALICALATEVPIDLVLKAIAIMLAHYAHKYMWIFYALDLAAASVRMDGADAQAMLDALAVRLEEALPRMVIVKRRRVGGFEPVQRPVDFVRGDGEANFARLGLHAAHIFGGVQRFEGGELAAVGGAALRRRRVVAILLFEEHAGDHDDGDAGPGRKPSANRKVESRHWGRSRDSNRNINGDG